MLCDVNNSRINKFKTKNQILNNCKKNRVQYTNSEQSGSGLMNFLNFELFQQFLDMFVLEVAISKWLFRSFTLWPLGSVAASWLQIKLRPTLVVAAWPQSHSVIFLFLFHRPDLN